MRYFYSDCDSYAKMHKRKKKFFLGGDIDLTRGSGHCCEENSLALSKVFTFFGLSCPINKVGLKQFPRLGAVSIMFGT